MIKQMLSVFKRRNAQIENVQNLLHLKKSLLAELQDVNQEMENLKYQIEFFGANLDLLEQKEDITLLQNWIEQEMADTESNLAALPHSTQS